MAKRNGSKNSTIGRDVPLPPSLPEHLVPYDTNNDGVLSEKEELKYKEAMMYKRLEQAYKDKKKKPKTKKKPRDASSHPRIVIR